MDNIFLVNLFLVLIILVMFFPLHCLVFTATKKQSNRFERQRCKNSIAKK